MEEPRLLDYVLLDLKSVDGKISTDSFVAMQQLKSLQDERLKLLQKILDDGHIGCSEDKVTLESTIWLNPSGLNFLASGGYRKRKKSSFEEEEKTTKKTVIRVLTYLIPIATLIFLALLLFEVI